MLKRILGLLGWLGVALVFAAVAIRFLKPEWQWYTNLALGGLVCTLLYMLSQWREVARSFSGREAKYGTVAVVSAIVVLAILVFANYLGVRHNKRWDTTAAKQFTLSDQTRKILEGLQKPVAIKVFAAPDEFQRFRDRLDEYQYASKQVSVEYIDAVKSPTRAQQYQVQQLGTVVFEYDGRTERVTAEGEQELTNGLIKVVQGKQQKVYFVQGHGEKSTEGSGQDSYSVVSTSLGSENYTVDKVVLAQQKDVPDDASVLIIAGPKTDFFAPEIDMLKRYLAKGGKILFMIDPPDKPESGAMPNLTALLKDWGVEVGNNVVVDVSGMGRLLGTGPEVPVAAAYQPHAITDKFNLLTAYRLARSISPITGGTSGKFPQTIVETGPNSWGETDIKTLSTTGEVKRDLDKGDKAGPVSLAAAVTSPATDVPPPAAGAKPDDTTKPETRIVVFGDSDFATNGWLGFQGNRDLFLNTVNWLSKQENLIAIRPREAADRGVAMTAGQQELVRLISVFGIPLLILAGGVFVWARRRG
jgi:ABC-type uncharacterized transport system involved in gliding motility auxiliary subunit